MIFLYKCLLISNLGLVKKNSYHFIIKEFPLLFFRQNLFLRFRKRSSILRSPSNNKNSQEQFEIIYFKTLIAISFKIPFFLKKNLCQYRVFICYLLFFIKQRVLIGNSINIFEKKIDFFF